MSPPLQTVSKRIYPPSGMCRPLTPFVALTLTLGAIGPLAYLIHRERVAARAEDAGLVQAKLQHA